ncbi:MAG TPA: hypothetical protein VFW47_06980 [Phenylobacterium sp.]|nr:hypothetical protein [Phenylobacterium sp.]
MHNKLISAVLAVVTISSVGCANGYSDYSRSNQPYANEYRSGCYPGERRDDCRERRRYEQQHQRRYVWRNDQYQYEERDATGSAIAGGIIGFILGAAIAGSKSDRDYYDAHRNDPNWRNQCAAQHPGFDPRTGTYLGPDGMRRYCVR